MKTSRKQTSNQRRMLELKIKPWSRVVQNKVSTRPRTGWLHAIRSALGISSRNLAKRMGKTHQVVLRTESRERTGHVTLEMMDRAAKAMNCQFVYAIIPDTEFESLEAIVDFRAQKLAVKIAREVSHSMKLESQGVDVKTTKAQGRRLADELKAKLDPRLWEK